MLIIYYIVLQEIHQVCKKEGRKKERESERENENTGKRKREGKNGRENKKRRDNKYDLFKEIRYT